MVTASAWHCCCRCWPPASIVKPAASPLLRWCRHATRGPLHWPSRPLSLPYWLPSAAALARRVRSYTGRRHACACTPAHWPYAAGLGLLRSCASTRHARAGPDHAWLLRSSFSASTHGSCSPSRRVVSLALRAVRRCHPATASVDIGYVCMWARPHACARGHTKGASHVAWKVAGRSSHAKAESMSWPPSFVPSTFGGQVEGRRRAKPVTVAVVQGSGANLKFCRR